MRRHSLGWPTVSTSTPSTRHLDEGTTYDAATYVLPPDAVGVQLVREGVGEPRDEGEVVLALALVVEREHEVPVYTSILT